MDFNRNQSRQRRSRTPPQRLADGQSVDASVHPANTTYVASYHTTGFYVATGNFFASDFTSGVLTAPSTATAGGNGVYAYGGSSTTGIFPTSTFNAANYWADVVFMSSASNTAPMAVADTADATEKGGVANSSGGSPATGNVLTNDTDPDAGDNENVTALSFGAVTGTLGTALAGPHGSLVLGASGDFTYTVNETDAAVQALRQSTDTLADVFSYIMRDMAAPHPRRRSRSPFTAPTTRRRLRRKPAARTRPSARPSLWCCPPAPSPTSMPATASPTRRPPPTAHRFPPG